MTQVESSRSAESRGRSPVFIGLTAAAILVAALVGVVLGLGVFTFEYAQGLSYLSSDPAACANCHIMQSQYDSWQRASHRSVAGCVDCHLPHHGLAKWLAKADNGYRHSKSFTLQDFHEPILMTAGNRRILQNNCLECHGDMTNQLAAGHADEVECVHCHRSVGHGERTALGGPERSTELQLER
jgi:cytochrome c nitrite reductase small subunit